MAAATDHKYYEVARPGTVAQSLLKLARSRISSGSQRRPERAQLDVGVSDVHTDAANWLEVQYPLRHKFSACGLGDAKEFGSEFPQVSYEKIRPMNRFPTGTTSLKLPSNAVLEHVGSHENQVRFVRELVRVAKQVFISVPHRYFPVEHHTGIPFLHYLNSTFRWSCWPLGKAKWNLILMTKPRLIQLSPRGSTVGYAGLPLGPLSSNLFMHYRKV